MGLIELNEVDFTQKVENDIGGTLVLPKNHKLINHFEYMKDGKKGCNSPQYYKYSQEKYNEYCKNSFPIIDNILNNVSGVVLCGGAALWLYNQSCIYTPNTISIRSSANIPKDFDLFIYEEDDLLPEDLIASQNKKINDIIQILIGYNLNISTFLVKGVLTIQLSRKRYTTYTDLYLNTDLCIQIILRDYCSISEIIHSFDISCCSIAWDGKKTYLTHLASWSILNNINLVIPEYRSNTYEVRLIKYFNEKNFALLLPNLNIPNDCAILRLLSIEFNIHHVNSNVAIADAYIPKIDCFDVIYVPFGKKYEEVDYDKIISNNYMINLIDHSYIFIDRILKKNCYFILNKKKYFEVYNWYDYKKNTNYNFIKLKISDIVNKSSYIKWSKSYVKKNIIVYQDGYKLNDDLIKYIVKTDYEQFAQENNLEQIKSKLVEFNEKIRLPKRMSNGKLFVFKSLINKLVDYMSLLYNDDEILDFTICLNRDIPLTGSLHPSQQTPAEWYGEHYVDSIDTMSNNKTLTTVLTYSVIDEHIKSIEELSICPLCFENIHYLSTNVIKLKCGHIYHEYVDGVCAGVNTWFNKTKATPSCPECRIKYPKKDIEF